MRKIGLLLIYSFLFIIVGYCTFFVFVNTKGKYLLSYILTHQLEAKVDIDSLRLTFPFNFEIQQIRSFRFSCKKTEIFLERVDFFPFQIVLSKVTLEGVSVRLKKVNQNGDFSFFSLSDFGKMKTVLGRKIYQKGKSFVMIRNFYLKDGIGEFIDFSKKGRASMIMKNISLELKDFTYPPVNKFYVMFHSSLWVDGQKFNKVINANGWVDYYAKNMNVNLNFTNLDYASCSKYFAYTWKPDNLGIKEAVLNLNADLISQNDNLVIKNVVSLDKIDFVEVEDRNDRHDYTKNKQGYLKKIMAILKGNKEKPMYNFTMQTKMSLPKFDFSFIQNDFIKTVRLIVGKKQ